LATQAKSIRPDNKIGFSARRRAKVATALAEAEARWLQSAEMLEQQAA
jgi:hypothetical protein